MLPRLWNELHRPDQPHCSMAGHVVVGFPDQPTVRAWENDARSSPKTIVSVRDVYLGHVKSTGASLLRLSITSIYWSDVLAIRDPTDNGRVGLVSTKLVRFVPPDTVVFVDDATPVVPLIDDLYAMRLSQLESEPLPEEVRLEPELIVIETVFRCRKGQLLVTANPEPHSALKALVVWRGDGRHRRGIVVSGHAQEAYARIALTDARLHYEPTHRRSATGSRRKYDRQRQRVLQWEDQIFGQLGELTKLMTPEECHVFFDAVYAELKVGKPELILSQRLELNCYFSFGKIVLAGWGRTKNFILHEIAHDLALRTHGTRLESHGPEFVRSFIELLNKFGHVDPNLLRTSASEAGLRF